MHKWSGRQNNGNHSSRTAHRKTKKWEQFKGPVGQYQENQHLHYKGSQKEKGEKGVEKVFHEIMAENILKYHPEEGNRYLGMGNTEGPKQDQSETTHQDIS